MYIIIVTLVIITHLFTLTTSNAYIIILNGTTTAGKTSIAQELAKKIEPVLQKKVEVISSDSYVIPKVIQKLLTERLNPLNFSKANIDLMNQQMIEELLMQATKEMVKAVWVAYDSGKSVIVDTVITEQKYLDLYAPLLEYAWKPTNTVTCQTSLEPRQVVNVLVYCPLPTLIERTTERNSTASVTDQRPSLQALYQFSKLYKKPADSNEKVLLQQKNISSVYDVIENTLTSPQPQGNFLVTAQLNAAKSVQKAICPHSFDDIKTMLHNSLGLEASNDNLEDLVQITPFFQHDIIVNTKENSSTVCAEIIVTTIQQAISKNQ